MRTAKYEIPEFLPSSGATPTLANPVSQLCTHSQFLEPDFARFMGLLKRPETITHRKLWEWVYIARVMEHHNLLRPGLRALVFGCGQEPLPSFLASRGVEVVATDAPSDMDGQGWSQTGQFSASLDQVFNGSLIDRASFEKLVSFRPVDMNSIPADLKGFDLLWSSCSLEHLGSLKHGTDFIIKAMDCLKPGGVAIHTTEFNLLSNDTTIETPGLSIYRRRDIEGLRDSLINQGRLIEPINFFPGEGKLDEVVDVPPYSDPHIKLQVHSVVVTSLGLVIRKRKPWYKRLL